MNKQEQKLRKLVEKWRGLRTSSDAFLSASAYGTYEMAADELEIVLAQAADTVPAPFGNVPAWLDNARQRLQVLMTTGGNIGGKEGKLIERQVELLDAILQEVRLLLPAAAPAEAEKRGASGPTNLSWAIARVHLGHHQDGCLCNECKAEAERIEGNFDRLAAASPASQPGLSENGPHAPCCIYCGRYQAALGAVEGQGEPQRKPFLIGDSQRIFQSCRRRV